MEPYMLKSGEGWTYRYGIDHTVKAGEVQLGRGAAVMEYTTRQGEEPPDHTHATEDELFYVLSGALTFHCGGETFEVGAGGFMYLPQGIEHGYTIGNAEPVRLLVVTFPYADAAGRVGWLRRRRRRAGRVGRATAEPERCSGVAPWRWVSWRREVHRISAAHVRTVCAANRDEVPDLQRRQRRGWCLRPVCSPGRTARGAWGTRCPTRRVCAAYCGPRLIAPRKRRYGSVGPASTTISTVACVVARRGVVVVLLQLRRPACRSPASSAPAR